MQFGISMPSTTPMAMSSISSIISVCGMVISLVHSRWVINMMPEHDLDIALTMYADHLIKDYNRWNKDLVSSATAGQFGAIDGKYDVWFERGRKFIKVVKSSWGSRSVHSFICIQPHGKFQFGDILKAASWAAPAKNFARGNVLEVSSYNNHRWTGA
jgi:hypothetical protein